MSPLRKKLRIAFFEANSAPLFQPTLVAHSDSERWKLVLSCTTQEDGKEVDRELTNISFTLPDESVFSATIQDIMALKTYAANAKKMLIKYGIEPNVDRKDLDGIEISMGEMAAIARMFSSK